MSALSKSILPWPGFRVYGKGLLVLKSVERLSSKGSWGLGFQEVSWWHDRARPWLFPTRSSMVTAQMRSHHTLSASGHMKKNLFYPIKNFAGDPITFASLFVVQSTKARVTR